jgi:hypothetical protein
MPANFIDLIGQRFGLLTVISRAENDTYGQARWNCRCDCGGTSTVLSRSLRKNLSTSCGCRQGNRKHGLCYDPIYSSWTNMRNRCDNPKQNGYKNYGGRGITYDPAWAKFENFLTDMGPSHREGLTIERIDVNGNYCAENCTWVPQADQSRNRRDNVFIETPKGVMPRATAAKAFGIHPPNLIYRMRHWPPERWLEPPRPYTRQPPAENVA